MSLRKPRRIASLAEPELGICKAVLVEDPAQMPDFLLIAALGTDLIPMHAVEVEQLRLKSSEHRLEIAELLAGGAGSELRVGDDFANYASGQGYQLGELFRVGILGIPEMPDVRLVPDLEVGYPAFVMLR